MNDFERPYQSDRGEPRTHFPPRGEQPHKPGEPKQPETDGLIAAGWLCAAIALILLPPVFGLIGVICGVIATSKGDSRGIMLIVGSVGLGFIGAVIGAIVFTNMRA